MNTAPSGISATASSKLAYTLFFIRYGASNTRL
jgi:hypothetical protein